MSALQIALFYEHPEWFKPLVAELERRNVVVHHINAAAHQFDPIADKLPFDLLVNRMSPSSYTRGHGNALFYAQSYLTYIESLGIPVINGTKAFALEISKARVVNHPNQVLSASQGLQFPVVVKANIGGSGAGITLFQTAAELESAVEAGLIDLGIDNTALVQEFLTPADGYIVRVEFLDGEYLYAIKVENDPAAGFNLCPADVCEVPEETSVAMSVAANGTSQTNEASHFDAEFCPIEAPAKRDVQAYTPPQEIIDTVVALGKAGNLEIGGIEYLVSDRDSEAYFYDINALSNFVANAPTMIGFDPFVNFADYLVRRAEEARQGKQMLVIA